MQMRKQINAIFTAVVSAVAGYAGTVSLDGTWQAEPAPEARGDVPPAAFTHAIPVPGHWPLMSPAAAPGKTDALWCRTTFSGRETSDARREGRHRTSDFGLPAFKCCPLPSSLANR